MTLQEIILALEKFWADQGCIIQQPCDIEVGAGTFNPATFLRCLGPEPWKVAYAEPVRRPTDGRYAENPFRLGAYYQYQVILKPAPENVLPLYLESLYHLGISPRKNDIRFVEDDWESPTLGASGLGWEVWWNGAEVTQFTYFQQMGSIELAPICAEITYGLERIALYLQDVDTFFDIRWNEHLNYGDVHHQSEVEYSTYNFENANVDMLFEQFSIYENETHACLDAGLVLPATDHVLKCSHTFNMLEARGVISVTERVSYIERVRRLAQRIARAYVTQREDMGHPLIGRFCTESTPTNTVSTTKSADSNATETADLLFEIGTEEIPASYVPPALEQLRKIATDSLTEHRIPFGDIQTFGTPRRIALAIKDIKTLQKVKRQKSLDHLKASLTMRTENQQRQLLALPNRKALNSLTFALLKLIVENTLQFPNLKKDYQHRNYWKHSSPSGLNPCVFQKRCGGNRFSRVTDFCPFCPSNSLVSCIARR